MNDKISVLFVCLGNICRSPAAEAVLRQKLEAIHLKAVSVTVDSAGIGSWHIGQLPDRRMRRTGERHGYDICSRARQVKHADLEHFTYVIGMDRENIADLKGMARNDDERRKIMCAADFMTRHPQHKTVPDPYYGNESDFELALELIEDACDGIIERLVKQAKIR